MFTKLFSFVFFVQVKSVKFCLLYKTFHLVNNITRTERKTKNNNKKILRKKGTMKMEWLNAEKLMQNFEVFPSQRFSYPVE